MTMIILIDNYDSFTWNLWHFLSDLGAEVITIRNDEKSVAEVMAMKPDAVVISPGPCTPHEAGICIDLITAAAMEGIPILGICLGFQSIGVAFGAELKRVDPPVHGKISMINHEGLGVMENCVNPVAATRYHSLILDRDTLPDCLTITAQTANGLVMGIEHKDHPIHGLLFHPESIASVNGYRMLANFLRLARVEGLAIVSDERLTELESRTLNLAERYPDHIHI